MARRKRKLTAKQKKRLKQAGWVAFGAATIMVARDVYLAFGPRRESREALYLDAEQKAQTLGRPLVVLGNPDDSLVARMLGRSWQCGNVCIDARGCPCGGPGQESVTGDPLAILQQIPPGSAVIFDPGDALRTAPDAYALAGAMKAAAGGWDNVFVAGVERYTLASWFEPKTQRVFTALPPVGAPAWKPLWWQKDQGGSGGTVAALQARPWAYNGVQAIPAQPWGFNGYGDIPAVSYGSYAQSGLGTLVWENYPQG
jgi:hypothetical protein